VWNDTVTRFYLKDLRFTLNEALLVMAVAAGVAAGVAAAGGCEGVHSFYTSAKYSVLSRTKYSAHSRFLAESFQGRDDIIGAHRW
jgi:hypothetical protein